MCPDFNNYLHKAKQIIQSLQISLLSSVSGDNHHVSNVVVVKTNKNICETPINTGKYKTGN